MRCAALISFMAAFTLAAGSMSVTSTLMICKAGQNTFLSTPARAGAGTLRRQPAPWGAQRLGAHLEAKGAHALLQLLLHVARNVLLG